MSEHSTVDTTDGPAVVGPIRNQFDWDRTAPSEAIAGMIATANGGDVAASPPLYESIDPDVVDGLFEGGGTDDRHLSFTHDDLEITLRGDGTVVVRVAAD
ncbi:HalOD1 output domain-containing protein [Haloarcula litorea]|uniref:HalOD1 output domain-containing protein n=1 Tax=Haloarcula litorea TaxID=3032579 RepID=UPI0023E7F94E|nr:HalOD1 output domain-containing protein [Halomicroarcula sp. GDY20]